MILRDLGFILNEEINVLVINPEGRLVAMYDGKDTIPEQFLDRDIDMVIKVTFNTIWVQIK